MTLLPLDILTAVHESFGRLGVPGSNAAAVISPDGDAIVVNMTLRADASTLLSIDSLIYLIPEMTQDQFDRRMRNILSQLASGLAQAANQKIGELAVRVSE